MRSLALVMSRAAEASFLVAAAGLGLSVVVIVALAARSAGRIGRRLLAAASLLVTAPLVVAWAWQAWQPGLGSTSLDFLTGRIPATTLPRRFEVVHLWVASVLPLVADAALAQGGRHRLRRALRCVAGLTIGLLAAASVVAFVSSFADRGGHARTVGTLFFAAALALAAATPVLFASASVLAGVAVRRRARLAALVALPLLALLSSVSVTAIVHGRITTYWTWPFEFLIAGLATTAAGLVATGRRASLPSRWGRPARREPRPSQRATPASTSRR